MIVYITPDTRHRAGRHSTSCAVTQYSADMALRGDQTEWRGDVDSHGYVTDTGPLTIRSQELS